MDSERDVVVSSGRTIRVHDGGGAGGESTVLWHHGSPQTGALLEPLLAATAARGLRLISYARPSYATSTPHPGRTVACAAADVAQLLDALGIARVAVMGASGGGPHALACAALLPDRVSGAVSLAGLAPLSDELDWFAGMVSPGGLRAATAGRAARAKYEQSARFDETSFTAADWAALDGTWWTLGADAGRAGAAGPDGLIDDDVAFVSAWGFDVSAVAAPVLLVHGGQDRVVPAAHSDWLLQNLDRGELWSRPRDGHISVLDAVPLALDWLQAAAGGSW